MLFNKSLAILALGAVLLLSGVAQAKSVWRKVDAGFDGGQIDGVAMSPNGRHIVLSGGFSRHSSDGGVAWETVSSSPEIMVFGDNTHLFGVGSSQDCNQPSGIAVMYRSTDYGKTWTGNSVRAPMCFNDVFFLDSLYGWAVGSNKDSIVITKDGGKTLTTRPYELAGYVGGGVIFIDTLRGWVGGGLVGTDSAVLSTTDGGNSWLRHSLGVEFAGAGSIDFVDSLHGWLIGGYNQRRLFHSSDGGSNWMEQGPLGGFLEQVSAVDSLHVWVLADDFGPLIWRTVDVGKSWELEYSGPGGFPTDFAMVDSSHGVTVGDLGTVLIYAPLILGDLNADEEITAADVVLELNKVFLGQPYSSPQEAGDVNCDSVFTASDVVLLLNRAFLMTPFPCNL